MAISFAESPKTPTEISHGHLVEASASSTTCQPTSLVQAVRHSAHDTNLKGAGTRQAQQEAADAGWRGRVL